MMKETTPENRREFWKFQSAALSFQQAEELAARLAEMEVGQDLFYPLLISMHVLYARPFKQQERALRIPKAMVPNSLLAYHDSLIDGRDKMFAHHDRNTVRIRECDREEFASLAIAVENGNLHARQVFLFPAPSEFPRILELCSVLRQKCQYHLGRLQSACLGRKATLANGHYIVSSSFEGMAPLLRRCTD
jgi:hypothetical protein